MGLAVPFDKGIFLLSNVSRRTRIFNFPLLKALPKYHLQTQRFQINTHFILNRQTNRSHFKTKILVDIVHGCETGYILNCKQINYKNRFQIEAILIFSLSLYLTFPPPVEVQTHKLVSTSFVLLSFIKR